MSEREDGGLVEVLERVAAMVGWHGVDIVSTGESWIDGLDWTPVEVGNRVAQKVRRCGAEFLEVLGDFRCWG